MSRLSSLRAPGRRRVPTSRPPGADLAWYVDDLKRRGIRRVHVLAWRDLDDVDAGGSEVHADELMSRWAAHGLDVLHRTSAAVGLPATDTRNGYAVVRRGSRYSVFPRTIASELTRRMGRFDALVEIWNGVPVVLTGVVPQAAHHRAAPRPRPDVGPDPARPVGGLRPGARGADRAAVLPAQPDGHAV